MPAFLFAAGLDWLEGLLPLLFVGFWILSQVMAVFRRLRGGDPVVVERRAAPPPPRELIEPEPVAVDRAELEKQIEAFLRERVAGERPPRERRPKPAREPSARPPVRADRMPTPPSTPPSLSAIERRGADVARHVHDVFAHELSHLESSLPVGAEQPQPMKRSAAVPATQLAAMLRSPQTIRHVILLREVLERPTERW